MGVSFKVPNNNSKLFTVLDIVRVSQLINFTHIKRHVNFHLAKLLAPNQIKTT